ncbi:MAG TPA: phosphatase PAP2 family protein [Bacteroidales bacterium]|nr:phosphatase PAP2 family protein [Bacteroidales bacterium]
MDLFERLLTWDRDLFLTLNGLHSSWMDHFMWLMSETVVWLPFFLVFLYQLIRNKKSKSLWLILTFALLITFTDQIASSVFKPLIERLRPTHDPDMVGLVHIVNHYKGGHYGFFSSHAANVFAFAGLSLLFVRNWSYTVCILIWASIISYSRIYLGVHFPLDILTGAAFGMLSSIGFYFLYQLLNKGKSSKRVSREKRRRKSVDGFPKNEVLQLNAVLSIVLIVCMLTSYYLAW